MSAFKAAPLLDPYDVYQHLMDAWATSMQDDAYLIASVGWREGAKPREIFKVANKDGKLVWAEEPDYEQDKRRFKSDLVPAVILVERYFAAELDTLAALQADVATLERQLDEALEEGGSEDGPLAEVIEGEGEKRKITAKAVKARLKEIGSDPDLADERTVLEDYAAILAMHGAAKERLKAANELNARIAAKYPNLPVADIKTLVVDDKWLATLATAVQGELDRVSQTLTERVHQLAKRYATPLPNLSEEVDAWSARVKAHLAKMGASWR